MSARRKKGGKKAAMAAPGGGQKFHFEHEGGENENARALKQLAEFDNRLMNSPALTEALARRHAQQPPFTADELAPYIERAQDDGRPVTPDSPGSRDDWWGCKCDCHEDLSDDSGGKSACGACECQSREERKHLKMLRRMGWLGPNGEMAPPVVYRDPIQMLQAFAAARDKSIRKLKRKNGIYDRGYGMFGMDYGGGGYDDYDDYEESGNGDSEGEGEGAGAGARARDDDEGSLWEMSSEERWRLDDGVDPDRADEEKCNMNTARIAAKAPLPVETARLRAWLHRLLDGVRTDASFVHSSSLDKRLAPTLILNGEKFTLPLDKDDAQKVIGHAKKAPFGRGADTIYDDEVRNTWQIEPAAVTLEHPEWERTVVRMVNDVAVRLGLNPADVSSQLYKCLLYTEGGHFAKHRDTEKGPGMIASLIVVLPSNYDGGVLNVYGRGEQQSLDFSEASERIHYVGFYSDCEHELLPVTYGNRLCVVYNLFLREGASRDTSSSKSTAVVNELVAMMQQWNEPFVSQPLMMYQLDHSYSEAGLKENGLKGRDKEVVQLLTQAREQAGGAFDFEAGIFEISENSSGNDAGWAVDFMNVLMDFQSCGLSRNLTAERFEQWCRDPAFNFLSVNPVQGEMDSVNIEPTGNEGTNRDRQYNHAVVFMWPKNGSDFDDNEDEGETQLDHDKRLARLETTDPVAYKEELKLRLTLWIDAETVDALVARVEALKDPVLLQHFFVCLLLKVEESRDNTLATRLDKIMARLGEDNVLRLMVQGLMNPDLRSFYSTKPHARGGAQLKQWLEARRTPARFELLAAMLRAPQFNSFSLKRSRSMQPYHLLDWLAMLLNERAVPWTDIAPCVEALGAQFQLAPSRAIDRECAWACAVINALLEPDHRPEAWQAACDLIQGKLLPAQVHPLALPATLSALHRRLGATCEPLIVELAAFRASVPHFEVEHEEDTYSEGKPTRRTPEAVIAALTPYVTLLKGLSDGARLVPEFLTQGVSHALALQKFRIHGADEEVPKLAAWWLATAAGYGVNGVNYVHARDAIKREKKGKEKVAVQMRDAIATEMAKRMAPAAKAKANAKAIPGSAKKVTGSKGKQRK